MYDDSFAFFELKPIVGHSSWAGKIHRTDSYFIYHSLSLYFRKTKYFLTSLIHYLEIRKEMYSSIWFSIAHKRRNDCLHLVCHYTERRNGFLHPDLPPGRIDRRRVLHSTEWNAATPMSRVPSLLLLSTQNVAKLDVLNFWYLRPQLHASTSPKAWSTSSFACVQRRRNQAPALTETATYTQKTAPRMQIN